MESLKPPKATAEKAGIAKNTGNPVSGRVWPPLVVAEVVATVSLATPPIGACVGVGAPAGRVTVALGSPSPGVGVALKDKLVSGIAGVVTSS